MRASAALASSLIPDEFGLSARAVPAIAGKKLARAHASNRARLLDAVSLANIFWPFLARFLAPGVSLSQRCGRNAWWHAESDRMNRGKPGMSVARECSDNAEPLLAGERSRTSFLSRRFSFWPQCRRLQRFRRWDHEGRASHREVPQVRQALPRH